MLSEPRSCVPEHEVAQMRPHTASAGACVPWPCHVWVLPLERWVGLAMSLGRGLLCPMWRIPKQHCVWRVG